MRGFAGADADERAPRGALTGAIGYSPTQHIRLLPNRIAAQTTKARIVVHFDPDEWHFADEPTYVGLQQDLARPYVGTRRATDIPTVAYMTVPCLQCCPDDQAKDRAAVIATTAV